MEKINDIFESEFKFELDESADEVDGKHIIGKIRGSFFVPDGASRNKRFYKKEVWEKQLSRENIKARINERRMVGTISHEQPLNDKAWLEGRISHLVTKLEIREGKERGYGEVLVLNTPAGQNLNTFARAGVKLFTSSRADGSYKGEVNGLPAVNPDTFQLEGFDFVLDPGFLEASPGLAESLSKEISEVKSLNDGASIAPSASDSEGSEVMDKELMESVIKENGSLKSDLKVALKESEDLKEQNQGLADENQMLKEKLDKHQDQSKIVESYQSLGKPEEISEGRAKAEEILKSYEVLGTVEEVETALVFAKDRLAEYKELGSPDKVREALEKGKELILEYKELGSPSAIQEVFSKTKEMMAEGKAEKAKSRIKELSEELKVSEDQIAKVYGKMDEEEIKEFFKSLDESAGLRSKFRKSNSLNENHDNQENHENVRVTQKSRGQRMFERLSK